MKAGLAFVPCSNKKITDWSVPAWLMYLPSPSFQKVYNDAKRKADRVFIISANYGLLDPNEIIAPYDAHMKNADPAFVDQINKEILQLCNKFAKDKSVLSYCGKDYEKVLTGVNFERMLTGDMFSRFSNLEKSKPPKTGSTLPIIKIVAWAYLNQGCSLLDLKNWINEQYEHPITRKCQYDRILKSGFFSVENDKLIYAGHPADQQ